MSVCLSFHCLMEYSLTTMWSSQNMLLNRNKICLNLHRLVLSIVATDTNCAGQMGKWKKMLQVFCHLSRSSSQNILLEQKVQKAFNSFLTRNFKVCYFQNDILLPNYAIVDIYFWGWVSCGVKGLCTHYVSDNLKLVILLPPPLKCWACRQSHYTWV